MTKSKSALTISYDDPLLWCVKCTGRSFLDRSTLQEEKIDFVCINCGKRNYIDPKSPTGNLILMIERERIFAYGSQKSKRA